MDWLSITIAILMDKNQYSKSSTFVISPNTDLFFAGASLGEASCKRFVFSAPCAFTRPSCVGLFLSTVVFVFKVTALAFFTCKQIGIDSLKLEILH